MANKSVIKKMTDKELENYLKPDNTFVPDAVQYAYEVLKERGRIFSDTEAEQIQTIIDKKRESETVQLNGFDKYLTKDENAIELYSGMAIWLFSVFFGIIYGTILQVLNFVKLKNTKAAFISFIFGITFLIFQLYIAKFIQVNYLGLNSSRWGLNFLICGIGASGLFYIRDYVFSQKIAYRPKSFVAPLIISIIINAYLFIFHYKFLFAS